MSDDPDLQRTRVVRTIVLPEGHVTASGTAEPADPVAPGMTARVIHLDRTTITGSGQTKAGGSEPAIVSFDRRELDLILRVYGFKVADGEWKDYSIDMLKDRAVFSVYRRAHDMPLHCIEKTPKLARKQGAYSVTGTDGRILKRGHDLSMVLKVLERKRPRLKVV